MISNLYVYGMSFLARVMNLRGIEVDEKLKEELSKKEYISQHVRIRFVNREKNREFLEPLVSVSFKNLEGIFYIKIDEDKNNMVSVLITKEMYDELGINIDDMLKIAIDNEEKCSCIRRVGDIIEENEELQNYQYKELPMLMITNTSKKYGAVAILSRKNRNEIVRQFGNTDCYIIPFNVHNVLAIKKTDMADQNDLLNMVVKANTSFVKEKEFLADAVYLLKADTLDIDLVAEKVN